MCGTVNPPLANIIQRLNLVLRVRGGSDIDRHYAQVYGGAVAGYFTMVAIADEKLGNSADGKPKALLGAQWVVALITYFLAEFPDQKSSRFVDATDPLKVLSVGLEASYPGIIKNLRLQ